MRREIISLYPVFDVQEEDEWILFIYRLNKTINERGAVVHSAFGFKTKQSAQDAEGMLSEWLDSVEIYDGNDLSFFKAQVKEKSGCILDGDCWKPHELAYIDPDTYELYKVLQGPDRVVCYRRRSHEATEQDDSGRR